MGKVSIEAFYTRIFELYYKIKKYVVYVCIILIIGTLYFGEFLGEDIFKTCVIIIFTIFFETLNSISENLKNKTELYSFPSIYEALPKIKDIVHKDKQITSIKIIAATGGTTIATIIPSIISSSQAKKIDISIGILDPNITFKEYVPFHWHQEGVTTIERLKTEYNDSRVTTTLFLYKILPVTHGLLINNKHLFLSFFNWVESGGKCQLSGAQLPHRYYQVSDYEYTYYFNLFESWFTYCPQKLTSKKLFIFDYDGTLVDSYVKLHEVYSFIAKRIRLKGDSEIKFIKEMIKNEDQQDDLRNFDRHIWWTKVFNNLNISITEGDLINLIRIYWEQRAKTTKIIDGREEILKSLKNQGILTIVCGSDGKYGNKKERIQKSGLGELFENIIVVGEDVNSLTDGVNLLIKKNNITENNVVVFDDKPFPINEISKNMKKIGTVKIEFEGILKLAWKGKCTAKYTIRTHSELKKVLSTMGLSI